MVLSSDGNTAFVANGDLGLWIVDITDKEYPYWMSTLNYEDWLINKLVLGIDE